MKKTSLIFLIVLIVASSLLSKIRVVEKKESIIKTKVGKVEVKGEFKFEEGPLEIEVRQYGTIYVLRAEGRKFFIYHPKSCLCAECSEMGINFRSKIPFEPKEGNGLVILLFPNESRRIVLRCTSPKESLFKIVVQDINQE